MQAAADIHRRLLRAAVRRRAPLWLAVLLPWVLLLSPVGAALSVAWIGWDVDSLRARIRRHWCAWLDRSLPWLEDSSALLAEAHGPIARMQRARILERIQADLRDDIIVSIIRERVAFDWRAAAASAVPALALLVWWQLSGEPVTARAVLERLAPQALDVMVRVTPPRYTGVALIRSEPRDLSVPQDSVIEWCGRPDQATPAVVELSDGRTLEAGPRCARVRAAAPLSWRWRGRRYQLAVVPDRAPEATVSAPQALDDDADGVTVGVRVRDDFRVRRAALHLTLVRSVDGEAQVSERQLALPHDGRLLQWSRHLRFADLGLQPGDELYLQAQAFDNAEAPQLSFSSTVALRVPAPGDDASVVLQRRVVAGIQKLRAEIAADSVSEEDARNRADSLASLQDLLRERYAVYLDEDGELAPIDAAARPAVRRAALHMFVAAEELRGGAHYAALPAAQRALAAVTELQAAERLHLYRLAAVGTQVTAYPHPAASALTRAQGQAHSAQPALQARARIDTPFARAWRESVP